MERLLEVAKSEFVVGSEGWKEGRRRIKRRDLRVGALTSMVQFSIQDWKMGIDFTFFIFFVFLKNRVMKN
ncbi:hypothetical protein H5410_026423 [Solanum commersonii]|uniref:Uncharacterized protein n=1 Tax=Solanum commersonii TaxID=4109 RepID=A0A9J5YW40_SOLCO|nr:hypothetical protein H5410_026423 [Solanum commersonii]